MAIFRFLAGLVLATFCICSLPAQSSLKINESFRNRPLAAVLKQLSKKYHIDFAVDDQKAESVRVSCELVNYSLEEAMPEILKASNLDYAIHAKLQVTIFPREVWQHHNSAISHIVKGTVRDFQNKQPLPYANIKLNGISRGVTTDEQGRFELILHPGDPDTIAISYLDYERLKVKTDTRVWMNIFLQPVLRRLDDVVITDGNTSEIDLKGPGAFSLSPGKLRLPSAGDSDPLSTLQRMPGVASVDESAANLFVRGGTPDQNLIQIDGIPIYQPGHFPAVVSALNPRAVREINVFRGGFGVRYGGRLSGVIDMVGYPLNSDKSKVGAGANLLNANAYFQAPAPGPHGVIFGAFRRSLSDISSLDWYQRFLDQQIQRGVIARDRAEGADFSRLNPRFAFGDAFLKMAWQPGEADYISLTAFGSRDRLSYNYLPGGPAKPEEKAGDEVLYHNTGVSGTWARQWNSRFYSTGQAVFAAYSNQYDYYYDYQGTQYNFQRQFSQDNAVSDLTFRQENRLKAHVGAQELVFGMQGSLLRTSRSTDMYDVSSIMPDTLRLTDDLKTRRGSLYTVYAEYHALLFKCLSLVAGSRETWYTLTSKMYHEPRASLNLNLSRQIRLKAAAGQYHQFIHRMISNNDLGVGEDFWMMADADSLLPSQGRDVMAGITIELKHFLFEAEAYRKWQKGLLTYTFVYDPLENETLDVGPLSPGDADIKGIDLLFRANFGAYSGWVSYTLSQVRYQFPDMNDGLAFAANHDQRHRLNIVNMWKPGKWEFSAVWAFASGAPYTAATKVIPGVTGAHDKDIFFLEFGARNAQRLPAYHRLDISAARKIAPQSGRWSLLTGVTVLNAYNRSNIQARRYFVGFEEGNDDNTAAIKSTNLNLLGFTPNVFFQMEF